MLKYNIHYENEFDYLGAQDSRGYPAGCQGCSAIGEQTCAPACMACNSLLVKLDKLGDWKAANMT